MCHCKPQPVIITAKESRFTIVGPDEFDPSRQEISIDSPMARAVLGKAEGDVVSLMSPGGERTLEIVALRYETLS